MNPIVCTYGSSQLKECRDIISADREYWKRRKDRIRKHEATVYAWVTQDNHPIATITVFNGVYEDEGILWLEDFARIPTDEYKGSGRRLLQYIVDTYGEYKPLRLGMSAPWNKPKLVEYYREFGFEELDGHLGVMERKIK